MTLQLLSTEAAEFCLLAALGHIRRHCCLGRSTWLNLTRPFHPTECRPVYQNLSPDAGMFPPRELGALFFTRNDFSRRFAKLVLYVRVMHGESWQSIPTRVLHLQMWEPPGCLISRNIYNAGSCRLIRCRTPISENAWFKSARLHLGLSLKKKNTTIYFTNIFIMFVGNLYPLNCQCPVLSVIFRQSDFELFTRAHQLTFHSRLNRMRLAATAIFH